jgi:hypothetical protein
MPIYLKPLFPNLQPIYLKPLFQPLGYLSRQGTSIPVSVCWGTSIPVSRQGTSIPVSVSTSATHRDATRSYWGVSAYAAAPLAPSGPACKYPPPTAAATPPRSYRTPMLFCTKGSCTHSRAAGVQSQKCEAYSHFHLSEQIY